jgi:hypothetical protein
MSKVRITLPSLVEEIKAFYKQFTKLKPGDSGQNLL